MLAAKKAQEEEIRAQLSLNHDDNLNLEIQWVAVKGRGVFASSDIPKGQFVVEYAGEHISLEEAKRRDQEYEKDSTKGSFLYYFKSKDKTCCIDATEENDRLGRLINHSKKKANLIAKVFDFDPSPRVIFISACDIPRGSELLYDYGDRRKDILADHPWLKEWPIAMYL